MNTMHKEPSSTSQQRLNSSLSSSSLASSSSAKSDLDQNRRHSQSRSRDDAGTRHSQTHSYGRRESGGSIHDVNKAGNPNRAQDAEGVKSWIQWDDGEHLIAAAAVHLACKQTEVSRKVRDVINVGYWVLHNESDGYIYTEEDIYWELKESLITAEMFLLRALRFDTNVELPYAFLAMIHLACKDRLLDGVRILCLKLLASSAFYAALESMKQTPAPVMDRWVQNWLGSDLLQDLGTTVAGTQIL
ncbi:Cyclin- protein fam58a [Blyttiomyces sp. JEL0837]|nr:Cyclin- protein fam58a [Blyttiomyces sp. JEL0837]